MLLGIQPDIMSKDSNISRPGAAALENMKLLKHESSIFKVPKVPKKKDIVKKTQVLDEDVYVEVSKLHENNKNFNTS